MTLSLTGLRYRKLVDILTVQSLILDTPSPLIGDHIMPVGDIKEYDGENHRVTETVPFPLDQDPRLRGLAKLVNARKKEQKWGEHDRDLMFVNVARQGSTAISPMTGQQIRDELKPTILGDMQASPYFESKTEVDTLVPAQGPGGQTTLTRVKQRAADLDRVVQATDDQTAFIRAVNAMGPEAEGPRPYTDFDSFAKDLDVCLIGRDATNRDLPKREEKMRAWALFDQARNAKDNLLALGRSDDVNHSGASVMGYTSEYNNGAVLMPECWNVMMNDAWVLGIIKGGNTCTSATNFMSLSRHDLEDPDVPKKEDDFRSDVSESVKQLDHPLHYIVTVSVSEISALLECGYEAQKDDKYGKVLVPKEDKESIRIREEFSMIKIRELTNKLRVGQAIENLAGADTQSQVLLAGIRIDAASEAKAAAFVKSLKDHGLPTNDPDNPFARKTDAKIAMARERVDAETREPTANRDEILHRARREISKCSMLTVNDECKKQDALNEDTASTRGQAAQRKRQKMMLEFAVHRQVEEDFKRYDKELPDHITLTQGTVESLRSFVQNNVANDWKSPQDQMLVNLAEALDNIEPAFASAVRDKKTTALDDIADADWTPDELPQLWQNFRMEMAYKSGSFTSSNTISETDMVNWLRNFRY